MNILVIGDLHFKQDNAVEMQKVSNQLIAIAKNKQPDRIVVLGDILDNKDRIYMTPLQLATQLLKSLQDIAKLYVIVGNHDRRHDKIFLTDEHPFTAMKYWNNIVIIDQPQWQDDFVLVPYVESGRFMEALNLYVPNWMDAQCIFCHQEFLGAQMGPVQSIKGDAWHADDPYVISGHIHEYQQVQNNILYMGTPIQHRYCDVIEKYIGYFTFDNLKPKHHDQLKVELITLNLPVKKIINIAATDVNKFKLSTDFLVQLNISGSDVEIKTLMKHPKLDKWRKQGVKCVFKQTSIIQQPNHIISITQESFSTMLKNRIDQHNKELMALYHDVFSSV